MTEPLDLERFKALLAAYGARLELFPEGERARAQALLESSEAARSLARAESRVDDLFLRAPAGELTPALARRLAEVPARHPRAERPRFAPLFAALGWAAAAAFGVLWGARSEADGASADLAAETATSGAVEAYSAQDADDELIELALGAVSSLEEEP